MAGTLTHFKLMQDLDKKLDIDNKDLFLIAGQGHDLLFFVRLKDLKQFSKRSNIVSVVASKKFKILIECWQEEVINTNNKELEIMLYGYVAHHIMDYYIHSWINKELGCFFDKKDKLTWKNNGKHEIFESIIDVLVFDYKKFKIPKLSMRNETVKSLDKLFKKIYGIDGFGKLINDGISNVKCFINIYRKDKFKIKRLGYKLIDKFSSKNHTKYVFLSFNYSKKEKENVRNNYLDKFNQLYNLALRDSENMIGDIKKSLQNKKVQIITFDKSAL